jgi:molybdate transport system substrate-binding protein
MARDGVTGPVAAPGRRGGARAVVGAIAVGAAALLALDAGAAEVRVLSAAAVQVPVEEVAAAFERETGHKVVFEFATAGQVEAKVKGGATPSIVVNSQERSAALRATLASDPGRIRPLGTVRIGIAARAGAPRPDLSSVAAFRESLLRAQSIAYGDPAGGATTGVHFAKVLGQLGIEAEIKPKAQLAANGLDVMRRVKAGQAELGVTQVSEILHIDAPSLVGPLPQELQLQTTYVAFLLDGGNAPAAQFLDRLVADGGRARFRAAGFD